MIRLWNSASRSLETFKSIEPQKVRLYCCGPTVYQRAHIGNLRAYVTQDLLRRVLEQDGYAVRHVMNITDVGHLTDDADAGEDKVEKMSRTSGESAWEIARRYTEIFLEDIRRLNILEPTVMPRATEYISEQIELVQLLKTTGHTYQTHDGIYFDTATFPSYGRLSGQALDEKEAGTRVTQNIEKRHPADFALWKFSDPGEKRQMEWESPWGMGFPGWHIECSAMSHALLGHPLDIHAGGIDHIPVHHENEIAQSEAAFGSPFVNYWIHNEFLLVDERKMSKSLGNVYTLANFEEQKIDPFSFRYFLLGAHYRQKQNFTWEAVSAAAQALKRLRRVVRTWDAPLLGCADFDAEFLEALQEDLNTPRALAVMWKLVESDRPSEAKAESMILMSRLLGLGLEAMVSKSVEIPQEIREMMSRREHARANRDWDEADHLRVEMLERGWMLEDTTEGQKAVPLE